MSPRKNVHMIIPSIPEGTDLREAAKLYATQGIYVGPLLGKNPGSILGKGWQEQTTIDLGIIDEWFDTRRATPEGIFIHCGRSGLVAFDVDQPELMHPMLKAAFDTNPPVLETRQDGSRFTAVFSLNGVQVGNSGGLLGSEWGDVRGTNGVIVVPPSSHVRAAEGGRYSWKYTGTVPVLPPPLLEALSRPASNGSTRERGQLGTLIPVGARDETLTRYAFQVSGYPIPLPEQQALVLNRLRDLDQPDDYMDKSWALQKLTSALAKREKERRQIESVAWSPVDLGPYLDGSIKPVVPSVGIERSDGIRLLYPGKEHTVIGEMESGKSWFALNCATAEIEIGNDVVYVHFEEGDPRGSIDRLILMGLSREDILARFHFLSSPGTYSRTDYEALLERLRPSLLVLDGVNEGMAMHGFPIKEAEGASKFRQAFVTPAKNVGAAVLALDHVVKSQEARGKYAYGSVHKANAIDGSLIVLENVEPFGRGRRGRTNVSVSKDRPGFLRSNGKVGKGTTFMGTFVVDTTDANILPGNPVTRFLKPPAHDELPSIDGGTHDNKILDVVGDLGRLGGTASFNIVRESSGMGSAPARKVLDRLVKSGRLIESRGPRNSRVFELPPSTVTVTD